MVDTAAAVKDVGFKTDPRFEGLDYHALNAMLNLYDADGNIQFEADKRAAREYFLQHVNQNTVFFHSLKERLDYLVEKQYYEPSVLEKYPFSFIQELNDRAYAAKFRANPEKWRFVTGPVDKVRALVEGPFMNSMVQDGVTKAGAPQISHNGYFILVDEDLTIRGIYDSSDVNKLDELQHHARYLARTGSGRSYKFGGG